MNIHNTYATVDLDAIAANVDAVRQKAGVKIMAVVKANAYGHGAVAVAKALEDRCDFFGVSCISEALELRCAGIRTPILIFGHTHTGSFAQAVRQDIRPTIFCYEDALALSAEAQKQGKTAPFHFAVDTGMNRIGLPVSEESADLCAAIAKLPNLYAEGLFSHFATADSADLTAARQQAEAFARFDRMLKDRGLAIPIRHLDNSAGIMNFSDHYEMVRCGIATYGIYPSAEVSQDLLPLRPALQWFSRVTHVKTLPAGEPISYGGTYVTSGPTVVATVPVGYADGYRRNLSNRFYVLIHGQKAPILGRVCMDQMMVDVTCIPDVRPEDRVVLLGTDGDQKITAEQLAEAGDSFPYELVCNIGHRVPRIYLRGGKPVCTEDYLLDR